METLSEELLVYILGKLEVDSLLLTKRVNKNMNRMANTKELWIDQYKRLIVNKDCRVPDDHEEIVSVTIRRFKALWLFKRMFERKDVLPGLLMIKILPVHQTGRGFPALCKTIESQGNKKMPELAKMYSTFDFNEKNNWYDYGVWNRWMIDTLKYLKFKPEELMVVLNENNLYMMSSKDMVDSQRIFFRELFRHVKGAYKGQIRISDGWNDMDLLGIEADHLPVCNFRIKKRKREPETANAVSETPPWIETMTARSNLGRPLDLDDIEAKIEYVCDMDVKGARNLIVRIPLGGRTCTVFLFKTGNCVILGPKEDYIHQAWDVLKKELNRISV